MIDIKLQGEAFTHWYNTEKDPARLISELESRNQLSDRKSRLFGVACCTEREELLKYPVVRKGLELAELLADGYKISSQLNEVREGLLEISKKQVEHWRGLYSLQLCLSEVFDPIEISYNTSSRPNRKITEERSRQCDLLRDIIGNPLNSIDRDSLLVYLTPDVVNLINCAYFQRLLNYTLNPQCLYALSDALEEAGCDSIEILDHLRQNRLTHVRGCWVVDLLLGKE